MDGKITISRTGLQKGGGDIDFTVEDSLSGLVVTKFTMRLEEFAECITGVGMCSATIQLGPDQYLIDRIGKKRETKTVALDWKKYGGDVRELEALIEPHLIDGWELFANGLNSQQNSPGHTVVLRRFVDETLSHNIV